MTGRCDGIHSDMETTSLLREMNQALLPRAGQLPDVGFLIASSDDDTLSFKQAHVMNDNVVFESG